MIRKKQKAVKSSIRGDRLALVSSGVPFWTYPWIAETMNSG